MKDISFSLEEAGAVILLGQSGSGKTMTCRAILGLLNSSAFQVNGEIFFDNRSLVQLKEKERALYLSLIHIYKGILKFADEKKPQLSFAVVLSVLSSAFGLSLIHI